MSTISSILWFDTGAWYSDLVILGFHIALIFMLIWIPYMSWRELPDLFKMAIKLAIRQRLRR